MAIQSIMPGPVNAELSGAGSFFGSSQLNAGNFDAILTHAQEQVQGVTPGMVQEPSPDPEAVSEPVLFSGEDTAAQSESPLLNLLKIMLGSEDSAEYAEFAGLLESDELESAMEDGELNPDALLLVIQQLIGQLETMIADASVQENGTSLLTGDGDADVFQIQAGKLLDLFRKTGDQLQALLDEGTLQEDAGTDDLLKAVQQIVQDFRKKFQGTHSDERAFSARITPDVSVAVSKSTESAEAVLSGAGKTSVGLAEKLAELAQNAGVNESESAGEDDVVSAEPAASTARSSSTDGSSRQTETVMRFDGGELKIQTVDTRTGTTLSSSSVDQQQRIQDFEVVRQVADKVRFLAANGTQQMTLQLNPEHLGQVQLKVALRAGEMHVHALVETEVAQRALENNISSLRDTLEKQNIVLDGLEVSVERQKNDASSLANQHQNGGGRSRFRKQGGEQSGRLVQVGTPSEGETGRRLGYNTMEYLA